MQKTFMNKKYQWKKREINEKKFQLKSINKYI